MPLDTYNVSCYTCLDSREKGATQVLWAEMTPFCSVLIWREHSFIHLPARLGPGASSSPIAEASLFLQTVWNRTKPKSTEVITKTQKANHTPDITNKQYRLRVKTAPRCMADAFTRRLFPLHQVYHIAHILRDTYGRGSFLTGTHVPWQQDVCLILCSS